MSMLPQRPFPPPFIHPSPTNPPTAGTLTTNQMTCVSLVTLADDGTGGSKGHAALNEYTVEGVSYNPQGHVEGLSEQEAAQKGMEDVATVCALCNEARIVYQDGKYDRIGEPTEAALKVLVEKLPIPGMARAADPFVACNQYNSYWEQKYSKLATLEFSRDRKSMSVLARSWSGGGNRLFVKGAPDLLINRCVRLSASASALAFVFACVCMCLPVCLPALSCTPRTHVIPPPSTTYTTHTHTAAPASGWPTARPSR